MDVPLLLTGNKYLMSYVYDRGKKSPLKLARDGKYKQRQGRLFVVEGDAH